MLFAALAHLSASTSALGWPTGRRGSRSAQFGGSISATAAPTQRRRFARLIAARADENANPRPGFEPLKERRQPGASSSSADESRQLIISHSGNRITVPATAPNNTSTPTFANGPRGASSERESSGLLPSRGHFHKVHRRGCASSHLFGRLQSVF